MTFRVRLTLLVGSAIALTVASASLAVWIVAKHELRNEVDNALAARVQLSQTHHSDFGPLEGDPTTYVQPVDGSGNTVPGALIPVTSRIRAVASHVHNGYFADQVIRSTHVRLLVAPTQNGAIVAVRSLKETDHSLHRIGLALILIGGAGVALAAALAAFVAAAALRPVRRLTAAADQVASTGDLTERVHVSGGDELGRLAARFNAMLAALEGSVGAQRRLVADASHELRTPLTAVRTNMELIREGKLPADEAKRALDEALVEVDSLTSLLSDLVELARGEERKLRIEEVQLDDLVASSVERAKSRAPHATFVTSLSHTQVQADPVLLERAVSNLLDNAVKYSPPGAPIEVTVREGEVVVADHGPGVAPEDLPRIFDRFYRAASARSLPGAGLGLAIVREAAEAHGGRATAETSPAGARFRLTLPVGPAPA